MALIAVIGATGAQGGSVVRALSNNPKYKVRAITRSLNSEAAKKLASQGIEVVAADLNDEASLVKAFAGVEGIFVVTPYWPSVPALGLHGAGDEEVEQFIKIAKAASANPALKHLVLSTLPPASEISHGKLPIPHWDYKQKGVEWIRTNRTELWAKTTEVWVGWYTSNLVQPPPIFAFVPSPVPGAYFLVLPSKPDGVLPIAGDLETNTGIVVEAVFEKGKEMFGKAVPLVTDYLTMTEVAAVWAEITGKKAAYAETTDEAFAGVWGEFGEEIALQMRFCEAFPDWLAFGPERVVGLEKLGVTDKLLGFKAALTAVKDHWA